MHLSVHTARAHITHVCTHIPACAHTHTRRANRGPLPAVPGLHQELVCRSSWAASPQPPDHRPCRRQARTLLRLAGPEGPLPPHVAFSPSVRLRACGSYLSEPHLALTEQQFSAAALPSLASQAAQTESVCLQCGRTQVRSLVGKIPCRRKWQPTLVLLPGKVHGRRSLVGYSPWVSRVRRN